MKTKSLEEVKVERNKLQDEIKIHFKIQTTLIVIVSILAIIVCFKAMSLAINYEGLEKENKELMKAIETKDSMISDLEEDCRELYIKLEDRATAF